MSFYLSVIIPTYKRNDKLKKLIRELVSQAPSGIKIEIIIIGNHKLNFSYKNFDKKNIKIKCFIIKKNSNAVKRNTGIKYSKGKNIILIDDDCLPEKSFISNYLKLFKKIHDKDILCGSVKYLNSKIKNENFVRYRQSRHFIVTRINLNRKIKLNASNIVTMNMGMRNSELLKKTKYFNEKFGGYGFEDYEFGYRLIKSGFNLIPSKPSVYHLDERSYQSYLNKIYFLARYSVINLKKINFESWQKTIYFKIENNLIINLFYKIKLIYPIINAIERCIEYIERNTFLYLPKLYRFGIFLSYCKGYYDRKEFKKSKNYDWYK